MVYGGTNSAFLDKTILYALSQILFLNCVESEKSVFFKCSYVTKGPGSDQTPRRTRGVWFGSVLFCPSISRGFPDNVTFDFCMKLHLF